MKYCNNYRSRLPEVEGFWQMMKYPESGTDLRAVRTFPYTRAQVSQMVAFEAKNAMKELRIDWVSFEGQEMTYCSITPGLHSQLILKAMTEKLNQDPEVKRILNATGDLILNPDNHSEGCQAPEWKYYQLWMDLRRTI